MFIIEVGVSAEPKLCIPSYSVGSRSNTIRKEKYIIAKRYLVSAKIEVRQASGIQDDSVRKPIEKIKNPKQSNS